MTKKLSSLVAVSSLDNNYLMCRGFNTVLEMPDDAFKWLQEQSLSNGGFSEQFIKLCQQAWNINVRELKVADAVYFRPNPIMNYTDASYELNLACNYRCEHCYLDNKLNNKLNMTMRAEILNSMCMAGVLRLHVTGGEPLLDKHFVETYKLIHKLGLLVRISTNGYALHQPKILSLLEDLPPTRISISLYGATEKTYESLTKTNGQGTFKTFMKSLSAAAEAELPIRLKIILTQHNENELEAMKSLAENFGFEYYVFGRLAPTLDKDKTVLEHQASTVDLRSTRTPFKYCNAGKTFFHVNPLGIVSICMAGRNPNIDLIKYGVDGLKAMPDIASSLLERNGDCSNCSIANTCATCPPMAKSYREAGADKAFFCQF